MESSIDSKRILEKFDPFSDRRSRDIRNQLSVAFVQALKTMDSSCFDSVGKKFISDHPAGIYYDYVDDRLKVYQRVFDQIQSGHVNLPTQQVPILWNHGLFFELHELLEEMWHPTRGAMRRALMGLIQAAGVYVHLEQGNRKAAANLAERAITHLEATGAQLNFLDGVADIVEHLSRLAPTPPRLKPIKQAAA
jgi:hypothetical protein